MNQELITSMSAKDMVAHLQVVEECEVLINPYHSNQRGFDLYFVPKSFSISMIQHIELITTWATTHRHTIFLHYDTFKRAIVAKINRLDPENTYKEEDIIR